MTIEIFADELFHESETIKGLSKSEFKELLSLATRDSHFIFDGTLYKQKRWYGRGFLLRPCIS